MTRVDDCGAPPPRGHIVIDFTEECANARNICAAQPPKTAAGQPVTILSTRIQDTNGEWVQGPITCTASAGPPGLDQAALHEAFVKLVPRPTIKTAPPNSRVLVNLQTLIWLDSPATVGLGTEALLGHHVAILATVSSVEWDFGDGHTDTSAGPGKPYTSHDTCKTKICPGWYGHVYTQTGAMTVTAAITWTGRYSVDGGNYRPISGTVTTNPVADTLEVYEARAVLVPN